MDFGQQVWQILVKLSHVMHEEFQMKGKRNKGIRNGTQTIDIQPSMLDKPNEAQWNISEGCFYQVYK